MATAFRPIRQASTWSCSSSSTVTDSGTFTVLEIAPEMNGCTAAIIRTWPRWWMVRSPIEQANTGRCSAAM